MREYFKTPAIVDISITQKCNLHCDYCSASAGPNAETNNEMSLDDYRRLFKELDDLHVLRVSISGGEPLIREDFFDILEEACKYDYATVINTNGTLITDELAYKLTKYSFDRICVTLDGSCAEIHEYHRGKGTFNKVLEGIKILQKYNLPVSTLFTLNEKNVEDLINAIRFNEALGMDYMTVMVVCPTGRATDKNVVSKEKWYPLFLKLSEMKANDEIHINFKIVPPNESETFWLYYYPLKYYDRLDLLQFWNQDITMQTEKRELSCMAGIKAACVTPEGKVFGCELMLSNPDFCAGSFKEHSFKSIWDDSEVFNRFRNACFENITGKGSKCKNEWCGGGCRSSAFNLTGSYMGSDLTCFEEDLDELA